MSEIRLPLSTSAAQDVPVAINMYITKRNYKWKGGFAGSKTSLYPMQARVAMNPSASIYGYVA